MGSNQPLFTATFGIIRALVGCVRSSAAPMRAGPLLALLADVWLRPTSQPIVSFMVAAATDSAGPFKAEASDRQHADPLLDAWRELLGDELALSEGKTTWNKMSFVLALTEANFSLLAPHQKAAVHAKLVAVSKQSVPATPRLAGMALRDRNSAMAKLEALGLSSSALADERHVGGHTIVRGKSYVIEPKEEVYSRCGM